MNVKAFMANIIWFLYSATRARTWMHASQNVEDVQKKILLQLVAKNAQTKFGRQYSFAKIDSVASFQQSVPIQTYEDAQPYVDMIAAGAINVLTSDHVQRFGVSSGSTKASKLVPYTKSFITEFQEGIDPWMYFLMRDHSQILGGKAYWSVTPVGERQKYSSGGIPIGFDDERSYFGKLTQWILDTIMATPSELVLVQDIDAFRYATLRFLLQEKSLTWVSIWNPSFATLFLGPFLKWSDLLLEDIRTGSMSVDLGVTSEVDVLIRAKLKKLPRRAKELEQIVREGNTNLYEKIWPHLKLISCWAHGNSVDAVRQLRIYFPNVVIQPKGLIATEAFVSFPLRGEASALSINSHFFEFEDLENRSIKLAHQLYVGKKYSVIVTTGGGLYRYRLNDVIEVLDYENQCPLIRFIGKQDKVVDICGEKLNEQYVSETIKQLLEQFQLKVKFWMLAPSKVEQGSCFYTLFVQFEPHAMISDELLEAVGQETDRILQENYHYNYCRRLGQLERCRIFLIAPFLDAYQTYLTVCTELGQRLGDIKSVVLHPYQSWSCKFEGKLV
ncbi:MAG: hypothetical protein K0S38_615 [Candidatus Paceibacter sp.]|jgi:hypothetical protein|nr:hypothetical protein [Candidatus Paceibacter sp.]